jgi:LysM repeat protein
MNCGTVLSDAQLVRTSNTQATASAPQYDFRHGETDLMESELRPVAARHMLMLSVFLITLMVTGGVLAFAPTIADDIAEMPIFGFSEETATPTTRPQMVFPSVTPGRPTSTPTDTPLPSPTQTPTPTEAPCMQRVEANDTLYALAVRCGHTGFDVLSVIVEENDLENANSIREGQELVIPWPTDEIQPTQPAPESNAGGDTVVISETNPEATQDAGDSVSAFDEDFDPLFIPTPTLRAGIQFHNVQSGETMISIAQQYQANAEVLSQLNPEITFAQCDFGQRYGGPECIVTLNQGQLVRVPAPTPTPTLSPTPSGSETITPTPTPTFNAPSLQSPSNRALFRANDLITLRWIPSGTLAAGEIYQVTVEDITAGVIYIDTTVEPFYLVPEDWQGTDSERHDFRWQIAVISAESPDTPLYTTEQRTFTWESTQETE